MEMETLREIIDNLICFYKQNKIVPVDKEYVVKDLEKIKNIVEKEEEDRNFLLDEIEKNLRTV